MVSYFFARDVLGLLYPVCYQESPNYGSTMNKYDAIVTITLNVAIYCRKTFSLHQILFVALSGFTLFLEACVGQSGFGAGVSLSTIAHSKRYAVAGRRDRNDRYRPLLVHVALLCPTLVRLFSAVLGTKRSFQDY